MFRYVKNGLETSICKRKIHLLYNKAFINGEWVSGSTNETFKVLNPVDNKVITEVTESNADDATKAVEVAAKAFKTWENTTAKHRSQILRKWYELCEKNVEELANILTLENGKPLAEARGEITYGNSFFDWFSGLARVHTGDIVPSPWPDKKILITRQPVGVVSIITPFNFPFAMITRKISAAIVAGCTCVIRPSEDTPLSALALAQLAHEAGLPPGVINVVPSSRKHAAAIGKVMCQHTKVAAISFTGSTEVGKILYGLAAQAIKRISLELGGNAPFIVFESANVDKAVEGAMTSKFRNAGQTCVASNRFLIHEKVFDQFIDKLSKVMKERLVLGDGMSKCSTVGPLINEAQFKKVKELVDDAVCKGATVMIGGKPATHIGDKYFEPTIIKDVTPKMRIYNEEIFGPIVECIKFKDEDEVLEIANSTSCGLASYFYSNDLGQVFRVSKKLQFGMVGVNDGLLSCSEGAFGGIKDSGIGREGSLHGMDEYTYIKYNLISGLSKDYC